MLAGLALVAQVHRHLPFVVGVVLGHTDSFGVHSFGKLVLLVGRLQVQAFPEVLLHELCGTDHPVEVGIQVLTGSHC